MYKMDAFLCEILISTALNMQGYSSVGSGYIHVSFFPHGSLDVSAKLKWCFICIHIYRRDDINVSSFFFFVYSIFISLILI